LLGPSQQETAVEHIQGNPGEIHELARYEVRPEALDEVMAAIHEFVAYVRTHESGALRYEVWQEKERPTRFVHIFVWKNADANRIHGQSAAVKKFAGTLYPKCLAPVEFVEYTQIDANAAFARA
jgi:quinol monooxygenase YgiN